VLNAMNGRADYRLQAHGRLEVSLKHLR